MDNSLAKQQNCDQSDTNHPRLQATAAAQNIMQVASASFPFGDGAHASLSAVIKLFNYLVAVTQK